MKLKPEQLSHHLRSGLQPLYLVFGDEPLQLLEASDAIRAAARQHGCAEREVLNVETGFDWPGLISRLASGSLFSPRRLVELRLDDAKPGDVGGKVLLQYAAAPNPDIVLLISTGRLDASTQKTRWFSGLEKAGVVIQTRPLNPQQLSRWIEQRLQRQGLKATPDALSLLIERVEGNLLAAAQEIDKLGLQYAGTTLDADTLMAQLGHQAHYTVFELVDAALKGEAERALRIHHTLQAEDVELVLMASWALAREVQLLGRLQDELANGDQLMAVFARHKIWEQRKPVLQSALKRLSHRDCRELLIGCAALDRCVKGVDDQPPWLLLQRLVLRLAGASTAGLCVDPTGAA